MQFSTRAEYGLKAVINLASSYPRKKSLPDIASEENISNKYLEQLFAGLRKKNIIKSYRGKNGGYTLASSPDELVVGRVIEVLEGSLAPMNCSGHQCVLQSKCLSKKVWIELERQIRLTLNGILLSDLIK